VGAVTFGELQNFVYLQAIIWICPDFEADTRSRPDPEMDLDPVKSKNGSGSKPIHAYSRSRAKYWVIFDLIQ